MRHIAVKFILGYLRFFARLALKIHRPNIVGIAGSVGKSSTRNALHAILQDHFRVEYTSGNSETGVPLGILGLKLQGYKPWHWFWIMFMAPLSIFHLKSLDVLIIEMGTDDPFPPKNMEYLLTIVKPDMAVFLNAAPAHTMQFEKALTSEELQLPPDQKLERILQKMAHEDGKIITQSGCALGIYNADNVYARQEIERFSGAARRPFHTASENQNATRLITFGEEEKNQLSYVDYRVGLEKTMFGLQTPKGILQLSFKGFLLPKEYREVFGATVLVALELGLTLENIKEALEKHFVLPKGRASLFKGVRQTVLIDSSYNASRTAVEAFLELGALLKQQTGRPLVVAFGDMNELGREAKEEHEAVAKKIAKFVDECYLVGRQTKAFVLPYLEKHQKKVSWFVHSRELGSFLQKNVPASAIVLFKGSQNGVFLEEAVQQLLLHPEDQNKLCRQEKYWVKSH